MKTLKIMGICMLYVLLQSCSKKENSINPASSLNSKKKLNSGTVYYISKSTGNDSNDGLSQATPWKSLFRINLQTFAPNDWVLLKSGDTWTGESLYLHGQGSSATPILLAAYGTGNRPIISPGIMDEACIHFQGNSGWRVLNIELSNAKDGIRATYDQVYNHDYLSIESCYIHDMTNTYNSNPNLYNHFSNGVCIEGYAPAGAGRLTVLSNFHMTGCWINNCNQGFVAVSTPFNHCNVYGFTTGDLVAMVGIAMSGNIVTNCVQWGASYISCNYGTMSTFTMDNIGGGNNPYGVAAIVVADSQYINIDGANIQNVYRGPNLSGGQQFDGDGFDFEGGIAPDGTLQHNITLTNSTVNNLGGAGILNFDNGSGHPSLSSLIDHVTISRFGQTAGGTRCGIYFSSGTTGTVSNCTYNRNITSLPFNDGFLGGYTFTNDVYNNIP